MACVCVEARHVGATKYVCVVMQTWPAQYRPLSLAAGPAMSSQNTNMNDKLTYVVLEIATQLLLKLDA